MKYCTRCKRIFKNEELASCPVCTRKLLSEPNCYSPVDMVTANGFELERIKAALKDSDIPFTVQEVKKDAGIQILNSAPPENCKVFVPLNSYTQAAEVLIGIGALDDAEELNEEDEQRIREESKKVSDDDMSPRKRFWVKVISIIIFIGLIAATVFLADLLIPFINPNWH